MSEHDKTVAMAIAKLTTAAGVKALPWEAIIAAIMNVLKGCGIMPPAEARRRLAGAGLFLKLQLLRKLKAEGLSSKDAVAARDAAIKAAGDASDEEAAQFMTMASALDAE